MNTLIGHLHPLIVHLPIGILLLAIFFAFVAEKEKFNYLKSALPTITFLGALSAILACITGYILSQSGDYEGEIVEKHQWTGIATAVLSLIAYFIFKFNIEKPSNFFQKGVVILTTLSLMLAGHYGGSLTHGSDYISLNFQNNTVQKADNIPPQYSDNSVVFEDIIQPILDKKCVSCHSESKQKGKLRLDKAEFLQKGGENGAIFVAGKPDESHFIKQVFLPLEHKEHMPPKEKPQLTDEEKNILKWWVEQGADFHKTVKDYPNFKNQFAQNAPNLTLSVSYVPEVKVQQPDFLALEALQKMNIVALPIAKDNPFVSLNFINSTDFYTAKPYLDKLSKNIIWVKMEGEAVNDSTLTILSNLENVTKLSLAKTSITDIGVKTLSNFKKLVYLNIKGSKISINSLSVLKNLPNLKRLYLYETAVQAADYDTVKAVLSNVIVDFGNYQVPTLQSDTTLVMPLPTK